VFLESAHSQQCSPENEYESQSKPQIIFARAESTGKRQT
jgi:hypothetical protein